MYYKKQSWIGAKFLELMRSPEYQSSFDSMSTFRVFIVECTQGLSLLTLSCTCTCERHASPYMIFNETHLVVLIQSNLIISALIIVSELSNGNQ